MNEKAPIPKIESRMKRAWYLLLLSLSAMAGFFVALFVLLRVTGLLAAYRVPTNSMSDFLRKDDHILAEAFSLSAGLPKRGDVMAFTTEGITSPFMHGPAVIYFKRVLGLPGDALGFKGGVLHINNRPVGEYFELGEIQYVPAAILAEESSYTVPAEHLFMMGDNSANSSDSRYWGAVPVRNLRHKYLAHYFRADRESAVQSLPQ